MILRTLASRFGFPKLLGPCHVDFGMQRKVKIQTRRACLCRFDDEEIRQPPCLFLLVDFNHRLEVC